MVEPLVLRPLAEKVSVFYNTDAKPPRKVLYIKLLTIYYLFSDKFDKWILINDNTTRLQSIQDLIES